MFFFAVPIVTLYIVFRTPSEYKTQKKELCASISPYENFTLPDVSKLHYIYSDKSYPENWKDEDKILAPNGKRIHWDKTYKVNGINWERSSVSVDDNVIFKSEVGYYGEEKMVVFNNYYFSASGPFKELSPNSYCYDWIFYKNEWDKKYLVSKGKN